MNKYLMEYIYTHTHKAKAKKKLLHNFKDKLPLKRKIKRGLNNTITMLKQPHRTNIKQKELCRLYIEANAFERYKHDV